MGRFQLIASAAVLAAIWAARSTAENLRSASEAGYFDINATTNKHYFYWYFPSQNNATTDPVVMWLTGGPGCSSMVALVDENGPCQVNEYGNGTIPRKDSWNKKANVFWVDQPPGTGYSYSDITGGDYNEAEVAYDLYRFIQAFFKAHPNLATLPFYIFGESYAGHYVPSIAQAIYQNNQHTPTGDIHINLQGIGIGNGLVTAEEQYWSYPVLAYNYSMEVLGKPVISLNAYTTMMNAVPGCLEAINACNNNTADCVGAYLDCNLQLVSPYQATGLSPYDIRQQCNEPPLCTETGPMTHFFNNPDVQRTLGVNFILWMPCDPIISEGFMNDWMIAQGPKVIPLLNNGTRVLVYSGDMDYICNWLGGQRWTLDLPWSGKAGFNAAAVNEWSVNGKPAGQSRSFGPFTFLRVYNGSHMVPQTQPVNALAMLNTFLQGEPFPS